MADNWIAGATANSHGQFAAKAKKAGASTAAYASKKSDAPGKLGHQARLARTLMGLPHHAEGAVASPPKSSMFEILAGMPRHAMGAISAPNTPSQNPMYGSYGRPPAPPMQGSPIQAPPMGMMPQGTPPPAPPTVGGVPQGPYQPQPNPMNPQAQGGTVLNTAQGQRPIVRDAGMYPRTR